MLSTFHSRYNHETLRSHGECDNTGLRPNLRCTHREVRIIDANSAEAFSFQVCHYERPPFWPGEGKQIPRSSTPASANSALAGDPGCARDDNS